MSRRRKSRPQEPVVMQVSHLAHDGRGIARLKDKIVFVFGALPGETVLAKYTQCYSRYDEAMTLEVLTPSLERVKPPCVHFGICGGCQTQHLNSTAQIENKQRFLEDQLRHQAKVTPEQWLAPLTGSCLNYRQKARLGVRYVTKKNALLVGFREQRNNKIAQIESCQILDTRISLALLPLRAIIGELEGRDNIPQIEVAMGSEEVALVFRHLQPLSANDIQSLTEFCKDKNFSLYLQPGGNDTVHKVWPPNSSNSSEKLCYELKAQNLRFHFHPLDFTQVNQQMNQKMIDQALVLLNPLVNEEILDLFCGLGNFSLPLAQRARSVVGVEGSERMVMQAQQNAKLNDLHNLEFYAADLSVEFSQSSLPPWAKRSFHKIILDPPRCGAQEIVKQISHFQAKEILYISCNPATFSRDAAILVHQQGFKLSKVGVMDMFPHTAHVEAMGLFQASGR